MKNKSITDHDRIIMEQIVKLLTDRKKGGRR